MNKSLRVFMIGWEFPPYISGGLGTACYGLTRGIDKMGTMITFVLPRGEAIRFGKGTNLPAWSAEPNPGPFKHVRFRAVSSALRPYESVKAESGRKMNKSIAGTATQTKESFTEETGYSENYGWNLLQEVRRYASKASQIASKEDFDVVHAHDWMSFPAGIAVARQSGKPLVVHVHSTEFDRSGINVNQSVYDIEREGLHACDVVISVSNYTRSILIDRYGVKPEKIKVVYNGSEAFSNGGSYQSAPLPGRRDKVVLFLGRITMQKGPEYFLYAAKQVSEKLDNVKFIMAGNGNMLYRSIELAAELGIGHKVLFTRFLRGSEVDQVYRMADLYVLPSVSEPFGLTPLEALQKRVPVLISRQSGVSEILRHALKVDFWDTRVMADKIIAVLKRQPLHATLREEGEREAVKLSWSDSASRVNRIYEEALCGV